jgi:hypothetical protein
MQNIVIGTIDKLIGELTALKETCGGANEVVVMQYTGGNEEPFYVTAVKTSPDGEHSGRILLEVAGRQL